MLGYILKRPPMAIPQVCLCSSLLMDYFSFIEKTPLHSCWPSTFFISQTQPQPRTCTVPHPYLARVRAHIEVRAGLEWTGWLSVKQTVQYLDLLWREQLPSHLLPEEVPPTVAMPVSQRWLLQTCTEKDGGYKVEKSRVILKSETNEAWEERWRSWQRHRRCYRYKRRKKKWNKSLRRLSKVWTQWSSVSWFRPQWLQLVEKMQ